MPVLRRNVDGNVAVVIIDFQKDFQPGGALGVPGGDIAALNGARLIRRLKRDIREIVRSHDQHHPMHVAHPMMYRTPNGEHPAPFKTLKLIEGEIVCGNLDAAGQFHAEVKIQCEDPAHGQWMRKTYLPGLENSKRYPHMLWPPHCLIGSPGAVVDAEVFAAVREWEEESYAVCTDISKGSNIRVEHFGALQSEVPDPMDPSTQMNQHFIDALSDPLIELIYLMGLALSHCLANTGRDVANVFGVDVFCKKCVLVRDATASVAGLEHMGEQFVSEFQGHGMRVINSTDI